MNQFVNLIMESLVCVNDFEDQALGILDRNCQNYFKSGSDDEITLRQNQQAFQSWLIRPRMLRDVSVRKLNRNILGKNVAFPVGVAPTAFQRAASVGTIFVLSTFSNWSIEDVAKQVPGGQKWFQLFPNSDRNVTLDMIKRAEGSGYEAIVVTLDAQKFGKKRDTMREPFQIPQHLTMANLEKYKNENSVADIAHYVSSTLAQDLTWETIAWIQSNTTLPIVLKGILTAEDAAIAVKHNVAAVWVSNHGGRQVDTVIPSIDALPEVVAAVNGKCQVYVDSGVRKGSDVFKALALGADMVFVGRPPIWGVAVAGEKGAKRILEILRDELDLTMALSGVAKTEDITSNYVEKTGGNITSKL